MTNSNYLTKLKPSSGFDAEPKLEQADLGQAAETAQDLATEGSGKKLLEPTADEQRTVENHQEVVSQRIVVTLDPICGMSVDDRTALQTEFDGKTFFFCSELCRQTFLASIAGVKPDIKRPLATSWTLNTPKSVLLLTDCLARLRLRLAIWWLPTQLS